MRNDFLDDAYANTDVMTEAIYADGLGLSQTIQVDFIRENSAVTLGVVDVQSAKPSLRARTTDIPNLSSDSTFTIAGVIYYVLDNNPMSHGETLVSLTRDPVK